MISYSYSYLVGDLVLLVIWLILFFWRKDTRREMVHISFLFGIIGLIVDPVYAMDWWKAATMTGTMPGIESFLFGFATAGIASVIYAELFNKKVKIKKIKKINLNLLSLLLLGTILFFGSVFILKLNSFQASFPALLIPTGIIWIKRKDLIINSIISGALLILISFVAYLIPEYFYPGLLNVIWNFEILSGIKIFGVVIEDLIWFFMAGLLIGPLYEYWQEGKLINIRN